jgi:hypothetical protein
VALDTNRSISPAGQNVDAAERLEVAAVGLTRSPGHAVDDLPAKSLSCRGIEVLPAAINRRPDSCWWADACW